MKKLKMVWRTEDGRLVCRWVDANEREKGDSIAARLDGLDAARALERAA